MKGQEKQMVDPAVATARADFDPLQVAGMPLETASPMISGTLVDVLLRLGATLNAEVAALQVGTASDISRFIDEKSRFLLYLECLAHSSSVDLTQEQSARIERVQGALEKNLNALRNHVLAARDVMKTVTECIEAAQSDGTYGRLQTVER